MKEGLKFFAYFLIIPAFLSVLFNTLVNNNLILANVLFYSILLSFFLFLKRDELKEHFKDLKNNYKKYIMTILKWTIIGFLLMIISNYIIGLFINGIPNNEVNNRNMILNNPILSLLYLLVIAPLVEEFVFRFGFRKIKNHYIYVLVSCLLFSSLHLLSITYISHLWYIIPYFFIGFGFSNVYYKCQNYFSSVFAHIFHNLLCVIIILVYL